MTEKEMVNHPYHYNHIPVECIDAIEHMSFNIGTAIKYLWRVNFKSDSHEDLKKSIWYILREMNKLGFIDRDKLDLMQEKISKEL